MVGLFEHEADCAADVLGLDHVLDVQRVLRVNRKMILKVCVHKARFEGADTHTCSSCLHA